MTFKEKLEKERRWNRRVMIINFYHNAMLIRDRKWSIRRTAKKLEISIGAASEAIRLCKAILDNVELEKCKTRKEALEQIK